MRRIVLVLLLLTSFAAAKQFGWVAASTQNLQLDPGHWKAVGSYGPGPVDVRIVVRAQNPVAMAMVRTEDWERAQGHKDDLKRLPVVCHAEGMVSSVYTCKLEEQPAAMVLVMQDQRSPGDAIGAALSLGIRRAAGRFVSSNAVTITHTRWACVANCFPTYRWVQVSKEKYQLYPMAKTYGPITPEHEGNQVRIKMKAPMPMLIAVLPVAQADRLRAHPAEAEQLLAGAPCKQRAVQKTEFTCRINPDDGIHQAVIMPEPGLSVPRKKKAEVEVNMIRCTANCD